MALTVKPIGDQEIPSDEEMLAICKAAEIEILSVGQSYQIAGSRSFTFANLAEVRAQIAYYEARILEKKYNTGGKSYLQVRKDV